MTYLATDALAGRTVLLTGASRGIGALTAATLGAAGANVIAQYRSSRSGAEDAVAAVGEDRKHLIGADLGTAQQARELWRAAEAWRPVDVLVVNAAVIPDTPLRGSDEDWDAGWLEALQVNVIGAGALMREAVNTFAERGSGTIIVLSSWAAQQGSRIIDLSAYAASKAAVRNLAQTFARNHARDGVRVHVVSPGVVDTGMGVAGQDASATQAVAEGLAMGKHVGAEEVANLIAFLATEACPSLTGGTIDINGASYIR